MNSSVLCRRLFVFIASISVNFFVFEINAKSVLTVGSVVCDTFVALNKQDSGIMHINDGRQEESFILLREGGKIDLTHVTQCTGGGAGNTAVAFQRLGCQASIYCKLGHDQAGKKITDEFEREGVDTSSCVYDDYAGSGASFIIPSPSGDRTALVFRGANTKLRYDEISQDKLAGLDGLYVTSLSGSSAQLLVPLVKQAHDRGVLVAVNPGSAQLQNGAQELKAALSFIDVLILNLSEAQRFLDNFTIDELKIGSSDKIHGSVQENFPILVQTPIKHIKDQPIWLSDFVRTITSFGPKIVLVTNGKEGAYAGTSNMIYYHPSLPVTVKITLGAGDAFGSTFFASTLHGVGAGQALRNATINSSSVVCFEGAKTGLLTSEQLAEKARLIGDTLLRSFRSDD